MSRIFEALQYAEKERLQRNKPAEQLREQPQKKFQAGSSEPSGAADIANPAHSCFLYAERLCREGLIDFLCRLVGLYPWRCSRCFRCFHRYKRTP